MIKQKNRTGFAVFFIFLILLGICLASMSLRANAEETDKNHVTVACVDYNGMYTKDESGTEKGYAVEYFKRIAEVTGWYVEFVDETWTEAYRDVRDGNIDFYCVARRNESREEDFDFSTYPLLNERMNMYVLQNQKVGYEDFDSFDGMRVGMLANSEEMQYFRQYMSEKRFKTYIVGFDSNQAAVSALKQGEVDAVALVSYSASDELLEVCNFGMVPAYIMSADNSALMAEFNQAQQKIMEDDPEYINKLQEKYFTPEEKLHYSKEEAAFVENTKSVIVGLIPSYSPLSYCDDEGEPAGIIVDIMNLIAQRSGLDFEYVFLEYGQSGYDFLTAGQGDIVAGVASSAFSTLNRRLLQSDTLLEGSIVFAGRPGSEFNTDGAMRVAIASGFINGERAIHTQYPNFTFYETSSNEEALKAVRDGRADVILQNMYVVREWLQSPLYDSIEIFPTYEFDEHQKVVALRENEVLLSVINKALQVIADDEINDILIKHTVTKVHQDTLGEFAYKFRYPIVGICLLFVSIIALTLTYIIVQHRYFKEIEQLNKKLENSNRQLAEAVSQAEHANDAKSQFLSRMSHEIRTPMNAIVGLTALIKAHKNEPEKVDEYLGKIDSSSHILLGIINDVLDMSAIESSKMKIAHTEFDLKEVLNQLTSIYYIQCKNKGIQFLIGVDLTSETVIGDSLRLNQILMNLISNAYKFTEKNGKISIDVSETNRTDKQVYVRFVVSDTGCGMNEDMISRLFKPFEQENAETAQKTGGSGLGLSIAYNLVRLMNGAINVKSSKGSGTTFTVDIPFELTGNIRVIDPNQLKHMRALIVDDDESARLYTSVVLERIGVTHDIAADADEAIEKLTHQKDIGQKYDICFIDWKMPGVDGIELTRAIRRSFNDETIVIIISAYDLSEVQTKAKEAGANLFVTKPLFQSTVFNIMMQLTGGIVEQKGEIPIEYDFTGHKVLLADDNEINREVANDLLSLVNMAVDYAENGKEAVETFENSIPGTYDLILMDIQMPEMDGYEATGVIRKCAHPEAKTIPIYAMTANAFTEDVSRAMSAGMNGHLAKPIDTKLLYQTIQTILNSRKTEVGEDRQ